MKKHVALGLVVMLIMSLLNPCIGFAADPTSVFKTFDVVLQDASGDDVLGVYSNYDVDEKTLYIYAPQNTSGSSIIVQGVNADDSLTPVNMTLSNAETPQYVYDDSTHELNLGAVQSDYKDEVHGTIDGSYDVVITVYKGNLGRLKVHTSDSTGGNEAYFSGDVRYTIGYKFTDNSEKLSFTNGVVHDGDLLIPLESDYRGVAYVYTVVSPMYSPNFGMQANTQVVDLTGYMSTMDADITDLGDAYLQAPTVTGFVYDKSNLPVNDPEVVIKTAYTGSNPNLTDLSWNLGIWHDTSDERNVFLAAPLGTDFASECDIEISDWYGNIEPISDKINLYAGSANFIEKDPEDAPIVDPDDFKVQNIFEWATAYTFSVNGTYTSTMVDAPLLSVVVTPDRAVLESIENKSGDLSNIQNLMHEYVSASPGDQTFMMTSSISGLLPNTVYYYAVVHSVYMDAPVVAVPGTYQFFGSDIKSFTTSQAPVLPSCTFETQVLDQGAYFSNVQVTANSNDYSNISFLGAESSATQDFASIKEYKIPYYNQQNIPPFPIEMVGETTYYRPFVEVTSGERVYGEIKSMTRASAPTAITLSAVPGVKAVSCDVAVSGLNWSGDGIFEVLYSKTAGFESYETQRLYALKGGQFILLIQNLSENTTYYIKAVVRSAEMTGTTVLESDVVTLSTGSDSVVTVSDLGDNQALFDYLVKVSNKTESTLMESDLESKTSIYADSSFPLDTLVDFRGIDALKNLIGINLKSAPNLTSLEGIEKAASIQYVAIQNSKISSLSPLLSLTNLKHINISNSNISDISGVEALTGLESLSIDRSKLTTLPDLRTLVNLNIPEAIMGSSSETFYLSFYENAIPDSEFVASKIPAAYISNTEWRTFQIASQKESFDPDIRIAPEYYGNSTNVPFFVEISNVNAVGYKLNVTLGGTPVNDLDFVSSSEWGNNGYYKAGIDNALSYVAANTPVSVGIIVEDDAGNEIYNEVQTVIFRTDLNVTTYETSRYLTLGMPNIYYTGEVYEDFRGYDIKAVSVLDQTGKQVMSSTDIGYNHFHKSSLYEDERYNGRFNHDTLPQISGAFLDGSLYRVADMPVGLYDLQIELTDGSKIIQTNAFEVVDQPLVCGTSRKYNSPFPTEDHDTIYVNVVGYDLDPEQIRPVIKSANGDILAEISGWRWDYKNLYEQRLSFELTKTASANWTSSNEKLLEPRLMIEAAQGYDLRVEAQDKAIFYYEYNSIYYSTYNPVEKVIEIRTSGYADGSYDVELMDQYTHNTAISSAKVSIVNGIGKINFQKEGEPYPFEENTDYAFVLIDGPQRNMGNFYCNRVALDTDKNDSYTTYFKEHVNSDVGSKSLEVYFIDEITAEDVVTATLEKDGVPVQTDIPVELSSRMLNDKVAIFGVIDLNLVGVNPGEYDVFYSKAGTHLKANLRLVVLDASKFIPDGIYAVMTGATTGKVEIYTFGQALSSDKFEVTLKDIFGNEIVGVQSTIEYDSEHNSYKIMLTNLPGDQGLMEAKVTYDGKEPYSEDDMERLYYDDKKYASLMEAQNYQNRTYFESYDGYVINGVTGEATDFPVTAKVYNPYDTGLVKQITLATNKDFESSDLTGLEKGVTYIAVLFSASGEVLDLRQDVYFSGIDGESGPEISVTGVSLDKTELNLSTSATEQLRAVIAPSDASNSLVKWYSSNEAVATVSGSGLVRAVGTGIANITVETEDGSFKASCTVNVTPINVSVSGISLNKMAITLSKDEKETLVATVLPDNASNKSVVWSSSDKTIATVSQSGEVIALKDGKATIMAKTQDGSFEAKCEVSVVTGITVTTGTLYSDQTEIGMVNEVLQIDGSKFPVYEEAFKDETNKPLLLTVKGVGAVLSNTEELQLAVTFDELSPIQFQTTGAEIIAGKTFEMLRPTTLLDGEHTMKIVLLKGNEEFYQTIAKVKLSNSKISATDINTNIAGVNLSVGDISYVRATVLPLNATIKTYTWASDNPSVATVDEQGKITAIAVGSAKLTVTSTDRNYTKEVMVTVSGNISGRLLKDGNPATYAWVYLENADKTEYSAYTNYKGEFVFKRVKPGTYTLKANAFDAGYGNISQAVQLTEGSKTLALGDLSFASIYSHDGVLKVNIKNESGSAPYTNEVYVYLNNYDTGTYKYVNVKPDANGNIILTGLSYSDEGLNYDFSISANAFWDYKTFKLSSSSHNVALNFNIPITYTVSGKLTNEGIAVPFESVVLKGSEQMYWGYTDQEGNYTFNGIKSGAYTLGVDDYSKFIVKTADADLAVTVTDTNLTDKNLSVITGADLVGNIMLNGATPAYKAYINLLDGNDQNIGYGTAGTSGFSMPGAIKKAGTYKLQISGVMNEDGTYPMYQSTPTTFVVTEDAIKTGRLSYNASYSLVTANSILSGEGNNVVADKALVKKGDLINVTVKYQNNGSQNATINFSISLPNGITAVNSSDLNFTVTDLAAGQAGQKQIPVRIGDLTETYVSVEAKATVAGASGQIDVGQVTLEKVGISINGPETAKVSEAIKIYGEATANTNIVIKDMISGRILATTKPNGRWYSANVTLDTVGKYALMAQIATDSGNVTEVSKLLEGEVSADPIGIENVKSSSAGMSVLPVNKVIGVRAFTAWVDSHLNGRDINIGTKFDKTNVTELVYHFSGKDYTATKDSSGYFTANLTGWSGAGLKTITATVKTNDGRTLNFIIAEVTVLIDPSGYIVDKETGNRLTGVTVICEVQDTGAGTWSTWNAELYGQTNPQVSDAEGNYGWMVPEGTYRVRAIMNDYDSYLSTEDTEHPTNQVIVIPPVRTDVNIFLSPTTWVTAVSIDTLESTVEMGKTLQLSATAIPNDAVNAENIKWRSSNTAVASVSDSGKVTAVAEGTTTITAYFDATAGEKVATKEITVVKATQSGGDTPGDNTGGDNTGGDNPPQDNSDDHDDHDSGTQTPTPSIPTSGGVVVAPGSATKPTSENSVEKVFGSNGEFTMKGSDLKVLKSLTIKGAVNLTFDEKALEAFGLSESVSVKVVTVDPVVLSEKSKAVIGNRPVFEFTVKDGDKIISNFGLGKIRVGIPYQLSGNEDPNNLVVYYVSSEGELQPMACEYKEGIITFTTSHFSKYAIGYNEVVFGDVSGWYADSVKYLSSKGIINGVGAGLFMPNKDITRAEVVQILSKLAGADLSLYKSSNFVDVKVSDWYMPAVEWAKSTGLANGTGNGIFNPNAPISRQDFAVMINNYLNKVEKIELPAVKPVAVFADSASVASYANVSVDMMQKTGLISGKPGNLFDPSGKATRAEAAKMLELLLKAMLQ
ncbi:Ig-like domain-containing protein [Fusibacter ferrireducens]|uniref:Ig-like domain-containing protein n=1 Tax=Fusibacter ferrireducens TaxID=2785058 RepID=A0ABR9ZVV2_9FIRM|nr:Ig-like domain-containing protein [Fusibacter ferrireducens]MBF4694568.1 Ig-like domain-containing protein [Fusibacter ferrireducens]